jgi:hypothetical protein
VRTPENAEAICEYIRGGMPAKWAARCAGISESVFFAWQAADPDFAERLKGARAEKIRKLVKYVTDAAPANWAAAMTLLERTEPEDFGRTNKVRLAHEGTVGIEVRTALVSPDQLGHIAALEASYKDGSDDTHGDLHARHVPEDRQRSPR